MKTFLISKYEQNELSYIKIHQQIKKLEFLSNSRKGTSIFRDQNGAPLGVKFSKLILRLNGTLNYLSKPSQLFLGVNAMKNNRLLKLMNFSGILWFLRFFKLTLVHKRYNNFFIPQYIWWIGLHMKSTQIFQHIVILFDAI